MEDVSRRLQGPGSKPFEARGRSGPRERLPGSPALVYEMFIVSREQFPVFLRAIWNTFEDTLKINVELNILAQACGIVQGFSGCSGNPC